MDLSNLTIVNTRPAGQAQPLSESIRQAGGQVIECPALGIIATRNWEQQLPNLLTIDQALFTSINAVVYFFKGLKKLHQVWPSRIKIGCIGEGSAHALTQFAIRTDFLPEQADSENLLLHPSLINVQGQSILLVKGEGGRPLLAKNLQARGAKLTILEVYKRIAPTIDEQKFELLWHNLQWNIILFTSHEAMLNIYNKLKPDARNNLIQLTWLVISERLAAKAVELGVKNILVSKPNALMDTLNNYKKGLVNDNQSGT